MAPLKEAEKKEAQNSTFATVLEVCRRLGPAPDSRKPWDALAPRVWREGPVVDLRWYRAHPRPPRAARRGRDPREGGGPRGVRGRGAAPGAQRKPFWVGALYI